jgi:hypothetical protein
MKGNRVDALVFRIIETKKHYKIKCFLPKALKALFHLTNNKNDGAR